MPIVRNLSELITCLRADCSGTQCHDVQSLTAKLQEYTGTHIHARFERVEAPDAGTTAPTRVIRRVILTSDRAKADFDHELVRQCNGIVLEYPTWALLAVPAGMFNPRAKLTEVVRTIQNYTVYDVKDGTTVTLYHYRGEWCMSTANGFDVRDLLWTGPRTYGELLNECIQTVTGAPAADFYAKLDPARCYTIGFRHHDFHPLQTDPQTMWFIQSVELSTLRVDATSVPASSGATLDASAPSGAILGIPLQTAVALPSLPTSSLLKWFNDKNNTALKAYLTGPPYVHHYGHVLRSKLGGSDVLIESDLLQTVRGLVYNMPKHGLAVTVDAAHRLEYLSLRAYLGPSRSTFISLFSQYKAAYSAYDAAFLSLITEVVRLLRQRRVDVVGGSPAGASQPPRKPPTGLAAVLLKLAQPLATHIRNTSNINVMNEHGDKIVGDFIRDRRNVDMYYTAMLTVSH